MPEETETREWYVRRSGTVQGPFRVDRIRRYLLLGRLRLSDRVSLDGAAWHPITQWDELIPDEMRDLGSEAGRARFEEARRAVDERVVDRERQPPPGDTDRTLTDMQPMAPRGRRGPRRPGLWVAAFGGLFALAAALVAIGYYRDFDRAGVHAADCESGASRVWNGCVKDGLRLEPGTGLAGLEAINASLRGADLAETDLGAARLDYADLSDARLAGADLRGAVLRGAILREADLGGADLRRADLRNADLRGAELADARLDGALLGNALWVDGRGCAAGSVGECR